MIKLDYPIYFGSNGRFRMYEFTGSSYTDNIAREYGSTIFVEDWTKLDSLNLPEIVFQEWRKEIESIDQVMAIVLARVAKEG